MERLKIYLLIALCAFAGALGQLFLKMASGELGWKLASLLNWKLIAGLVCYGITTVAFILALKYGRLSVVSPATIIGTYVLVILFSILILNESLAHYKWIGIALTVIGVIIIAK